MKTIKGKHDIGDIVSVLKSGGLVIMPTETVYIAAVDATNPGAVKKLVEYKNRPFGKPFSVGCSSLKMIKEYVVLNDSAKNLYKTMYPGPMTIVCTGKRKVAPGVESEIGTLGIFVTDHKLTIDVINKLGHPITTTSANASYKPRPFNVPSLLKHLSKKQAALIDLIVDVGEIPFSEASTVIDTTIEDMAILRQGEIKLKGKSEILSKNEEATQNFGKELWLKYQKYQGERALVFALEAPMGAGKTQFTKGLARAIGITDEITSPTYDLILEYKKSKLPTLVHIDTWRIKSKDEVKDLDLDNKINDKSVIAIEWAEKIEVEIRKYNDEAIVVWVKIAYGTGENDRLITWGVL